MPLAETVQAFEGLQRAGNIRYWGVSNLDLADLEALWAVPGGKALATDQLLYNLGRRGIEWDLLPWLRKRGVPVMAYSPIEQARLLRNASLKAFVKRAAMTPAQAALAWLLSKDDVIAIPKTSYPERVKENAAARDRCLTVEQLAELDALFPPPRQATALEML